MLLPLGAANAQSGALKVREFDSGLKTRNRGRSRPPKKIRPEARKRQGREENQKVIYMKETTVPDLAQAENKLVIDPAVIQNAEGAIRALFAIIPSCGKFIPVKSLSVIQTGSNEPRFKVEDSEYAETLSETFRMAHDREVKREAKRLLIVAAEAQFAKLRAELEELK